MRMRYKVVLEKTVTYKQVVTVMQRDDKASSANVARGVYDQAEALGPQLDWSMSVECDAKYTATHHIPDYPEAAQQEISDETD